MASAELVVTLDIQSQPISKGDLVVVRSRNVSDEMQAGLAEALLEQGHHNVIVFLDPDDSVETLSDEMLDAIIEARRGH